MTSGYPDWFRAIGLIGEDPDGNLILIQVDADGRLSIPLKGIYAGDLVTVAVDASGNLNAYVLDDESQWGDVIKVGNAELAGRLGSPVTYDWRGKVLALQDFKNGLGTFYTETSGTGAAVELDPTRFLTGGYSAKLTGGSDTSRSATLNLRLDTPPTNRVGVSIRWGAPSSFDKLQVYLTLFDGTNSWTSAIRYDDANDDLDYLDEDGNWQGIDESLKIYQGVMWFGLKFVIDKGSDVYRRCLFGPTEHDLSAYSVRKLASAVNPHMHVMITCYSRTGENDVIYIDSLAVTVGEPE